MLRAASVGVALSVLGAGVALACQPCQNYVSFEDTVARAQLVVIGTAMKEAVHEYDGENDDFMVLRVDGVLKGEKVSGDIRVQSWSGMCPYGLFMKNGTQAVVYLSPMDDAWQIVGNGCAEPASPVEDGQVRTTKGVVALDAFRAAYFPSK